MVNSIMDKNIDFLCLGEDEKKIHQQILKLEFERGKIVKEIYDLKEYMETKTLRNKDIFSSILSLVPLLIASTLKGLMAGNFLGIAIIDLVITLPGVLSYMRLDDINKKKKRLRYLERSLLAYDKEINLKKYLLVKCDISESLHEMCANFECSKKNARFKVKNINERAINKKRIHLITIFSAALFIIGIFVNQVILSNFKISGFLIAQLMIFAAIGSISMMKYNKKMVDLKKEIGDTLSEIERLENEINCIKECIDLSKEKNESSKNHYADNSINYYAVKDKDKVYNFEEERVPQKVMKR